MGAIYPSCLRTAGYEPAARLRLQQTAEHPQQRALAAAVGAQQHVQGASRNLKVCSS